ncbi:hypothetical protein RhiirC2_799074 [Rhizophagus irregularis]|uniref:Uncharacterized protein n=1 Tax=Rhizophagus irregularis TaxID=588596 RepID=A0A2N1M5J4_9GLOM|nr:hypothetical protein RhiirC2_799074 [Rhizophagus irregularis]
MLKILDYNEIHYLQLNLFIQILAFKISHDIDSDLHHVYFRFDKALETFGVRFIKENISGNVINKKNLKSQIKASQSERKRIDLLISEYLNDNSILHSKKAIKSRQESLWKLINDLVVVIFEMDDLEPQKIHIKVRDDWQNFALK